MCRITKLNFSNHRICPCLNKMTTILLLILDIIITNNQLDLGCQCEQSKHNTYWHFSKHNTYWLISGWCIRSSSRTAMKGERSVFGFWVHTAVEAQHADRQMNMPTVWMLLHQIFHHTVDKQYHKYFKITTDSATQWFKSKRFQTHLTIWYCVWGSSCEAWWCRETREISFIIRILLSALLTLTKTSKMGEDDKLNCTETF